MTVRSLRCSFRMSKYGVDSYSAPDFSGKKFGAYSPSGVQMQTIRRFAGPSAAARTGENASKHGSARATPAARRKVRRWSFMDGFGKELTAETPRHREDDD